MFEKIQFMAMESCSCFGTLEVKTIKNNSLKRMTDTSGHDKGLSRQQLELHRNANLHPTGQYEETSSAGKLCI